MIKQLLAAIIFATISTSAMAKQTLTMNKQTLIYTNDDINNYWAVGCYNNDNGKFSHCYVVAAYDTMYMYIMWDGHEKVNFKLVDPAWKGSVKIGKGYKIRLQFSGGGDWELPVLAGEDKEDKTPYFWNEHDINYELLGQFMSDKHVDITVGKQELGRYNLKGTKETIKHMMTKAAEFAGAEKSKFDFGAPVPEPSSRQFSF